MIPQCKAEPGVALLAAVPRIAFVAGKRVPMPSASDRLASKRQASTSQGLVPSALKNIVSSCFMNGVGPRGKVCVRSNRA